MKGRSWHEGCPVPLDDLAAIQSSYLGYDGDVHEGVLVIHKRLVDAVIAMFRELFDAKFRIERMQPYEDFPVGEYAEHNDTVGFYCRPAQDDPSIFSWHAYGLAVDLNPLTNPYRDPKEGGGPKDLPRRAIETVKHLACSLRDHRPLQRSCTTAGRGEAFTMIPTTCTSAR
jgi:hypothetical protein